MMRNEALGAQAAWDWKARPGESMRERSTQAGAHNFACIDAYFKVCFSSIVNQESSP
jgi:hypothetical protein